MPFDIACVIVLIGAILYTFLQDIDRAGTGRSAARPAASGE
jgi:hypothetical protein